MKPIPDFSAIKTFVTEWTKLSFCWVGCVVGCLLALMAVVVCTFERRGVYFPQIEAI